MKVCLGDLRIYDAPFLQIGYQRPILKRLDARHLDSTITLAEAALCVVQALMGGREVFQMAGCADRSPTFTVLTIFNVSVHPAPYVCLR